MGIGADGILGCQYWFASKVPKPMELLRNDHPVIGPFMVLAFTTYWEIWMMIGGSVFI
jgi:hypothetical protein